MKTIHELKEHESMLVEIVINDENQRGKPIKGGGVAYPYTWQVTRVATGWIYQNANPNIKHPEGYFVPLTTYSNPNI